MTPASPQKMGIAVRCINEASLYLDKPLLVRALKPTLLLSLDNGSLRIGTSTITLVNHHEATYVHLQCHILHL